MLVKRISLIKELNNEKIEAYAEILQKLNTKMEENMIDLNDEHFDVKKSTFIGEEIKTEATPIIKELISTPKKGFRSLVGKVVVRREYGIGGKVYTKITIYLQTIILTICL